MYAIIETGGKQYKVSQGDILFIEKLDVQPDETVHFDKVIALSNDDVMTFGSPTVSGAEVVGKIIKNGKGKKLTIFTYKSKKGEKRKLGHRQPYTKVQIETITA